MLLLFCTVFSIALLLAAQPSSTPTVSTGPLTIEFRGSGVFKIELTSPHNDAAIFTAVRPETECLDADPNMVTVNIYFNDTNNDCNMSMQWSVSAFNWLIDGELISSIESDVDNVTVLIYQIRQSQIWLGNGRQEDGRASIAVCEFGGTDHFHLTFTADEIPWSDPKCSAVFEFGEGYQLGHVTDVIPRPTKKLTPSTPGPSRKPHHTQASRSIVIPSTASPSTTSPSTASSTTAKTTLGTTTTKPSTTAKKITTVAVPDEAPTSAGINLVAGVLTINIFISSFYLTYGMY